MIEVIQNKWRDTSIFILLFISHIHAYIIPMPVSGGMTNVDYNKWWDAIPPYDLTSTTDSTQ